MKLKIALFVSPQMTESFAAAGGQRWHGAVAHRRNGHMILSHPIHRVFKRQLKPLLYLSRPAELDMGPFLLTKSYPIHGWNQSMSNSETAALQGDFFVLLRTRPI